MPIQLKLILAGIIVALIGYSYFWTFSQGKSVGGAAMLTQQVKIQKQVLQEQEEEFRALRKKEMRDAALNAKQLKDNNDGLRKALDEAKTKLGQHQDLANTVIPDDLIWLLNNGRGSSAS